MKNIKLEKQAQDYCDNMKCEYCMFSDDSFCFNKLYEYLVEDEQYQKDQEDEELLK